MTIIVDFDSEAEKYKYVNCDVCTFKDQIESMEFEVGQNITSAHIKFLIRISIRLEKKITKLRNCCEGLFEKC